MGSTRKAERPGVGVRVWWPALALVAAVALATFLVSQLLFDLHSPILDSEVYERQARELVDGRLRAPAAAVADEGAPPFFASPDPRAEGDWVWRYHPSVALLVASGMLVGAGRWWLPVLSTAGFVVAVIALGRAFGLPRPAALLAGALGATAPLLLLTGANVQATVPAAAFLVGATASLAGSAGRPRRQLLAGFLWGCGLALRPFEAAAYLVVLVVVAVRRRIGPWPAVAGALPPVVLTAALNLAVTGAPWRYPFWIGNPHDRFGFGWRAVGATEPSWFGPLEAVRGAAGALLFLVLMAPAGVVLVVAALESLRARRPGAGLLAGMAALPFVFYLGHWSGIAWAWNGLHHRLGPIYHLSVLAPLAVLAAPTLLGWWRGRRTLLAAAAIVSVALQVPWWAHVVRTNLDDRQQRVALHDDLARLPEGELVVVDAATTDIPYARLPDRLAYRHTGGRQVGEELAGREDEAWVVLDRAAVASPDPHLRGELLRLVAVDGPVVLRAAAGEGLTIDGTPCGGGCTVEPGGVGTSLVGGASDRPLVVVRAGNRLWVEASPDLVVEDPPAAAR
jgi:hypothetical protein